MSLQTSGKEPQVNVENVDQLKRSNSEIEDFGSQSFVIAPLKNVSQAVDTNMTDEFNELDEDEVESSCQSHVDALD